jgi:hypothetical protein
MPLDEFCVTYPAFQFGDELCLQGRRDVMIGYRYRAKQGKSPDDTAN